MSIIPHAAMFFTFSAARGHHTHTKRECGVWRMEMGGELKGSGRTLSAGDGAEGLRPGVLDLVAAVLVYEGLQLALALLLVARYHTCPTQSL